jgi:hypothetical protein
MHRPRAWGILVVLAGLGAAARASDPDEGPPVDKGNTAYHRWNGGSTERPKPPPPPPAPSAKAKAQDTAAALLAQEEANFLRRQAVCDKLRRLALETGDDSLDKQADELEQKAQSVYKLRTARLHGGKVVIDDPEPQAAVAPKSREGKR